ncbi:hypothetical protein NV226_00170 [Mycoplasma iguanae]|uniref:Uncharacterized protein n=1 Tax=Mycoplasma iguanae TaxID=292461 RepID=A0ABY5R9Q9_9MOLU|nr:hypothetical protein [Mycoplasma iguanae]UVD81725.1 hypothetical protein NV226_00170 [Mycoplasma iguanae]
MKKIKKDQIIRKIKYWQTFAFPFFIVIVGILATVFAFYALGHLLVDVISKNSFWN